MPLDLFGSYSKGQAQGQNLFAVGMKADEMARQKIAEKKLKENLQIIRDPNNPIGQLLDPDEAVQLAMYEDLGDKGIEPAMKLINAAIMRSKRSKEAGTMFPTRTQAPAEAVDQERVGLQNIYAQEGMEGVSKFATAQKALREKDDQWEDVVGSVGGKEVLLRRNKLTGKTEQVSSGPTGTTVNVGTGGKFDVKAGEALIKSLPKLQDEADTSSNSITRIDRMLDLLDEGAGGTTGRIKAWAAPYLESIGIKTQGLSDAQLYEVLANTLGGSMRIDVIGPGPVSEYEQELLQKVNAGGTASTGAARELLDFYRENAVRKIGRYNRSIEAIGEESPMSRRLYPNVEIPYRKRKITPEMIREELRRRGFK